MSIDNKSAFSDSHDTSSKSTFEKKSLVKSVYSFLNEEETSVLIFYYQDPPLFSSSSAPIAYTSGTKNGSQIVVEEVTFTTLKNLVTDENTLKDDEQIKSLFIYSNSQGQKRIMIHTSLNNLLRCKLNADPSNPTFTNCYSYSFVQKNLPGFLTFIRSSAES